MSDVAPDAGYHLQSVAYSAGTSGWVGVWLDTALGFHRDPAVTLHAPTRDQLRILAVQVCPGRTWTANRRGRAVTLAPTVSWGPLRIAVTG